MVDVHANVRGARGRTRAWLEVPLFWHKVSRSLSERLHDRAGATPPSPQDRCNLTQQLGPRRYTGPVLLAGEPVRWNALECPESTEPEQASP
jgi:hypothetical protein